MTEILISNDLLALCGKRTLQVYRISSGSKEFTYHHDVKCSEEDDENYDGANQGKYSMAFSNSGDYLALCTDDKQLILFETSSWTKRDTWSLNKRPTGVDIAEKSMAVLASDKAGDVYSFGIGKSAEQENFKGELILGHVSMILRIKLTKDQSYLVSADRDETLRINHFPNAYNIAMYCLGHTDFVSTVEFVESNSTMLLSGGGDGCVILWNMLTGNLLSRLNLGSEEEDPVVLGIISYKDEVFVICESIPLLYHLKIKGTILEMSSTITLNYIPWGLARSDDRAVILVANDKDAKLLEFDLKDKMVVKDGPMSSVNSLVERDCIWKDLDWSVLKLSNLRRFGKRREANGMISSCPETLSTKLAKKETTSCS